MEKTVIELFAGVGGFRVGFNKIDKIDKNGKGIENGDFKFVWANQWEPSTKIQPAFDCYNSRFPDAISNSNSDISLVNKNDIPNHSVLVGGFPCQDYSVAHSLSKSKGIEGKKGVLWWQIRDILKTKKSPFVLLENVDRLVKSPASQRGRDFGIMLRTFRDLGYAVEWRIINAADYGHPQRRRRIYIFAYLKSTKYYMTQKRKKPLEIINSEGLFAKQFAVEPINKLVEMNIVNNYKDLVDVSNNFKGKIENAGYMFKGKIYTSTVEPIKSNIKNLKSVVLKNGVDERYFLNNEKQDKFVFLRGNKRIERKRPNGDIYHYSEGSMSPYDELSLPGRTMLTSEGTTNRSTHIIKDPKEKKLRILTPIECERLNEFPDNWTASGMTERKRYFMMGNALVCGIIRKIGVEISSIIDSENE